MKLKMEQKTATLDKGPLADPKVFSRGTKVAADHSQQPKVFPPSKSTL